MPVIYANGRMIDLGEDRDGNVDLGKLRRAAGINSRALIVQRSDGTSEILPQRGKYQPKPDETFIDAPLARRGKRDGLEEH